MLLAYALINFRKYCGAYAVSEDSISYLALNLVGGALASASAILTQQAGSYPLAVLEGAWAIIGFIGLVRLSCGSSTKRDPERDQQPQHTAHLEQHLRTERETATVLSERGDDLGAATVLSERGDDLGAAPDTPDGKIAPAAENTHP